MKRIALALTITLCLLFSPNNALAQFPNRDKENFPMIEWINYTLKTIEKLFPEEKLAERVGVSTTYIGYIEIGARIPNLKMIYKIANALGIKVKDIFSF